MVYDSATHNSCNHCHGKLGVKMQAYIRLEQLNMLLHAFIVYKRTKGTFTDSFFVLPDCR